VTREVREQIRRMALWLCLGIFLARVIGQIEVVLLAPPWLPPFSAWESGLIPYPLLLPLQILVAAWMAAIASDHSRGSGLMWVESLRVRKRLNAFALLYASAMLLRLVITAALPPHSLIDRGLIPILAHWDLAGFLALVARTPTSSKRMGESHGFLHCTKGNHGQTAMRERVTLHPNAVGPLPSAYRSPGPS
jgi:hypothetical protein